MLRSFCKTSTSDFDLKMIVYPVFTDFSIAKAFVCRKQFFLAFPATRSCRLLHFFAFALISDADYALTRAKSDLLFNRINGKIKLEKIGTSLCGTFKRIGKLCS